MDSAAQIEQLGSGAHLPPGLDCGEKMLMRLSWLGLVGFGAVVLMSCGKNSKFPTSNRMYVATQSSAQIWGYHADFNNGTLSTINGSPFAAAPASAILIDPSQSFAYLADNNNPDGTPANQIVRYSFDLNGSPVPVTGGVPTGGSNPVALAMDSAGKFLFVANQGSANISVFSVGSGASLTSVGPPFAVRNPLSPSSVTSPVALAVRPSSNFLYLVDQNDNLVLTYQFDTSSGVLSNPNPNLLQPALVGTSPSAIAINPAGTFLFVANSGSSNVSGFQICRGPGSPLPQCQADGSLVPMDKSPFAAELGPSSAAVDPSGQFLYVTDQGSNQISGYRITAVTGDLTPTVGSPYNTGAGPIFVAISPINKFLYVSNNSAATISGFLIDPNGGNLASVSSAVTTGTQPTGIAFGK